MVMTDHVGIFPMGDTTNKLFEKGIGLITVEDLARTLGLASKTIRNWVSARKIPFVMIGRKTYFRLKSIEAWLEQKEYKSWQS